MKSSNDEGMNAEQVDYTNIIIKDMYEILTTRKNPWPPKYTPKKKIQFLNKILGYLTEHQMYEMCAGLQKVKKEIDESESNSTTDRD